MRIESFSQPEKAQKLHSLHEAWELVDVKTFKELVDV